MGGDWDASDMGHCTLEKRRVSFHTGRMKANPRGRALRPRSLSAQVPALTALALTALAAGCVPAPPVIPPAPPPAAARPAPPAPVTRPAPQPEDWRDAPITPGDWSWTQSGPRSVASFGAGLFDMRCDTRSRTITLARRSNSGTGPAQLAITTMQGTRSLAGQMVQGYAVVTLPAGSPVLDEMAFSRGRFAVALAGQPTLYIPSWTEVSRVIEDCR